MRHLMAAPNRPRLGVVTWELPGDTGQKQQVRGSGGPPSSSRVWGDGGPREGVVAAAPNDSG